jgi:acetyl-CoA C-acetyltransferase
MHMASGRETVILSGVRTAIGDLGGALKDFAPSALGAIVAREAMSRAGIEPETIDQVVFGNVITTEPRECYLARIAAVDAGIPVDRPAMTVNRLCGSGAQAIVSAAQAIALGEAKAALAGGAESMSQAPYGISAARFGQKMGDVKAIDFLAALSDPFGHGHMGNTAENLAERHQISRERQDAFAVESHRRAARAIAEGAFEREIVPIEVRKGRDTISFKTDEHVRADATPEGLGKLRPAFKKDGTVTAGNASGINDGAAALVLMEREEAGRRGLKARARIVSWGHAGVPPEIMGIGPVKAVPIALERAGLGIGDMDVIESNEAFAAQACAVADGLGLPPDRTNPNGGAVALGHPVGATGAIITVKALHELERRGGRYGLITLCIGGGQGIALVIERLG